MVVTCHSHLLSALLLLVLLIAHPAFATLTGYRAEQPINRGSDLDRLGLRSADKNGDGCLSFVEMAAFYSLPHKPKRARCMRQVLEDHMGDGTLICSENEYYAFHDSNAGRQLYQCAFIPD